MPVKIWLPWKRQIARTNVCHAKLLPDNNLKQTLPNLVTFPKIYLATIWRDIC